MNEYNSPSRKSLGISFLFWWIGITVVYTFLYFIFFENPEHVPSLGGHITGFVGLFAPVGVLSLVVGLLFPAYLVGNVVGLALVVITVILSRKIYFTGIKKILFILLSLFIITFLADAVRAYLMGGGWSFVPWMSWVLFIEGAVPPVS